MRIRILSILLITMNIVKKNSRVNLLKIVLLRFYYVIFNYYQMKVNIILYYYILMVHDKV